MIAKYRGCEANIRFYTQEELIKIDQALPETGASQEPGYYHDDIEDGEESGTPCGPYSSETEAFAAWVAVIDMVLG